jgi:hypothetical protein
MNLQSSTKHEIIEFISQGFESLEETPRKVLLGGLIFFFFMSASTTLLLGYYAYQPQVDAFFQKTTATPVTFSSVYPTVTPQCVRPRLTLGSLTYPIDLLPGTPSGVLPSTSPVAGTAWRIADIHNPYVFLLTPPLGSIDPSSVLDYGAMMLIQWADCSREEFVFTDLETGSLDAKALFTQTNPGIAVVIQSIGTAMDYVLFGQPAKLTNSPTPVPTQAINLEPNQEQNSEPTQAITTESTQELTQEPTKAPTQTPTQEPTKVPTQIPTQEPTQAPTQESPIIIDITFEDLVVSPDQKTLQIWLTITNLSAGSITVTNDDLSLTAENKPPLNPQAVEPALPQVIPPAGNLSLKITFTHPGGSYAELRVFDTTLDLFY